MKQNMWIYCDSNAEANRSSPNKIPGTHLHIALIAFAVLTAFILSVVEPVIAGPYDFRERGKNKNREEGLKEVPSASLDLRIVSFMSYRENMRMAKGDSLSLKFYVMPKESVSITAREILPVHHYFMKPKVKNWGRGWQIFAPWEVDEVLFPKGIDPNGLGVVGRVGEDKEGSGSIVPMVLYRNEPPQSVSSYTAVFLSRENLSKIRYTLSRVSDGKILKPRTLRKNFPANDPILIRLNLAEEPAGLYELVIHGKIKNKNNGPTRTYRFYHQPVTG